jgi:hypothetical protein
MGELKLEVVNFVPSRFGGGSYVDFNGDGIWDSNESGLGGVMVTLSGTDFRGDAVDLSQRTAADGTYMFENLRPGSYQVNQVQPTGMMDGIETLSLSTGTLGDDMFSFEIDIYGGLDSNGNLFGERGLHPSLWSIYNRSTAGGLNEDSLLAAGDESWFMPLSGWDGVTSLIASINGGVTATATKSSTSTLRTFSSDDPRIRTVTNSSGESVIRFSGFYDDFFAMAEGEPMEVESLDAIADEFPDDRHPADAVFASDAWA